MLSVPRLARIALACAGLTLPLGAGALSLGQVDDFEGGTLQGWFVGAPHPAPPANVASGGPAGAGDNYMQLTAIGGASAGSRLAVFNTSQWSGNYLAAGITGISLDLNNLGSSDLSLRLLFSDGGSNVAISSAVLLPAGSGWTSVQVPIAPGDLSAQAGSANAALGNVLDLVLFHGVTAAFPGETLVASLGVDNIRAVPEPSTLALLLLGLLALLRARPHLDAGPGR